MWKAMFFLSICLPPRSVTWCGVSVLYLRIAYLELRDTNREGTERQTDRQIELELRGSQASDHLLQASSG